MYVCIRFRNRKCRFVSFGPFSFSAESGIGNFVPVSFSAETKVPFSALSETARNFVYWGSTTKLSLTSNSRFNYYGSHFSLSDHVCVYCVRHFIVDKLYCYIFLKERKLR